jgi:hypothetical protein
MELIIEGLTWTKLLCYYGIALLGMVISMLVEQVKHSEPIKANGGFKWSYWIIDNWKRTALNLCAMLVGIMFSEQLLGVTLSAWAAFLSGYATDGIVDGLVNRKRGS